MPVIGARNPYSGAVDYSFEEASLETVDDTCNRLRKNQKTWSAYSVERRLQILGEFVNAISKNFQLIHKAVSADTGRTKIAAVETLFAANTLKRLEKEAICLEDPVAAPTTHPDVIGSGQYVPFGLVGNIAPWNYPIILSLLDTLPALLAGNAAVVKASSTTPRYADAFNQVLKEVPELERVFSFLQGRGSTVGSAVIERVDCICLTGSTEVGKAVAAAAGRRFIPAFLELGGNDPAVVLPSSDLDMAADAILWSACRACGQTCSAIERVYVPRFLIDDFIDLLVRKAEECYINYPDIGNGGIGPFIHPDQPKVVKSQLDNAVAKGARILTGGEIIDHGGKWMLPTVVVGVDHSMEIMKDETFGPVVPVMPYNTADEASELANDTSYGLSAAVFAGSVEEGIAFGRNINAGCISVNDASLQGSIHNVPHVSFGLSGLGQSRFGPDGILRFTRRKAFLANRKADKSFRSYNRMLDTALSTVISRK